MCWGYLVLVEVVELRLLEQESRQSQRMVWPEVVVLQHSSLPADLPSAEL